jgi:hypothetical protein
VGIIVRKKGSRRMGLPVEFPLVDNQGVIVARDRRRLPDRRKAQQDSSDPGAIPIKKMADDNLEDLLLLLQQRAK